MTGSTPLRSTCSNNTGSGRAYLKAVNRDRMYSASRGWPVGSNRPDVEDGLNQKALRLSTPELRRIKLLE